MYQKLSLQSFAIERRGQVCVDLLVMAVVSTEEIMKS